MKTISDQAEASTITPVSSGNLGDTTPPRQLPRVRGDATRAVRTGGGFG